MREKKSKARQKAPSIKRQRRGCGRGGNGEREGGRVGTDKRKFQKKKTARRPNPIVKQTKRLRLTPKCGSKDDKNVKTYVLCFNKLYESELQQQQQQQQQQKMEGRKRGKRKLRSNLLIA